MKKWLLLLLVFASFFAKAQDVPGKYITYPFKYGDRLNRVWVDSVFHLPLRDTNFTPATSGVIVVRPANNQPYIFNGTVWKPIIGDTLTTYATKSDLAAIVAEGGLGTVTNVSGTGPISVINNTSTPQVSIANGAADGSTKGAVGFNANQFNDNGSGIITLDTTNGPTAGAFTKGYLTPTDYNAFNSKLSNSLLSGRVFVGNGSNVATGVVMSGDATIDNAGALTVGSNAITYGKFQQGTARSILGVSGNSSANYGAIQGTANQVLRISSDGTSLGFGQVNLASSAAVTGLLPDANISSATTWNAKLSNITGYITQGSNVVITGSGTLGDPYVIASSGGGGGGGDYIFSSPLNESGGTVTIQNADANGSTKGAASFTANDFNATSGIISIDYSNGQAASSSNKGFLTPTDWSAFNNKLGSVTGTSNRITVTGGSAIDIASTYIGQNTITTVGTIGTGTWQGTPIATSYIANNAVTYAKIQNVANNNRLLGAVTAGAVTELTGTQVTAMLDNFSSSLKGLVPASGGGTTNFLRADGTWAAPPGGGGLTDGDYGDITVGGGATTLTIDNGVVSAAKLASDAVTTIKILDANVTDAKLATGINANKLADGSVSNTELQYISTVTSNVQTQIDLKQRVFNVKAYGAVGDGITDDRTAIQAAINAADAAGGGIVWLPRGVYNLGTGITTSDNTGKNPNSQLYLPYRFFTDNGRNHIIIRGEGVPDYTPAGLGVDFIPAKTGAVIRSARRTYTPGTSVIGSGYDSSGIYVFNYNYLTVENLSILVDPGSGVGGPVVNGINGMHMGSIVINNLVIAPDTSMLNSVQPTHDVFGVRTNAIGGETFSRLNNSYVMGWNYGTISQEHAIIDNVQAYACEYGHAFNFSAYPVAVYKAMAHWSKHAIGFFNGPQRVTINQFEVEVRTGTGKWFDSEETVYDPNNYGFGKFVYHICEAGSGTPRPDLFSMDGGSNLNTFSVDDDGAGGSGGGITRGDVGYIQQATGASSLDNSPLFVDGDLNIGVGTNAPNIGGFSAYQIMTLKGTNAGMIEYSGTLPDGDAAEIGYNAYMINGNSSNKLGALTYAVVSGSTANNRGANYVIATKPDGGSSAVTRLTIANSGELLQPASGYHNFGTTVGSSGYGIRDNSGTMQFKNSGGSWTDFGSGGSGSQSLQDVTDIGATTDNALTVTNRVTTWGLEFPAIYDGAPMGSDNTIELVNDVVVSNLAFLRMQPTSGNSGSILQLFPQGTGYDDGSLQIQSQITLWGMDNNPGATDNHGFTIRNSGEAATLNSFASGSATPVPIGFQINGDVKLAISSSGIVRFNNSYDFPTSVASGSYLKSNGSALVATNFQSDVRSQLSGGTGITYNSSTGVISATESNTATFTTTTTNNTPTQLPGSMTFGAAETGFVEVFVSASLADASGGYMQKAIIPFTANSSTSIVYHFDDREDPLPAKYTGINALTGATFTLSNDGSGDLTVIVTGLVSTNIVWTVTVKKYYTVWAS